MKKNERQEGKNPQINKKTFKRNEQKQKKKKIYPNDDCEWMQFFWGVFK